MKFEQELFWGLLSTDEWERAQLNDPAIKKAEQALEGMPEKWEDPVMDLAAAHSRAGFLYGMRVMLAICGLPNRPVSAYYNTDEQ